MPSPISLAPERLRLGRQLITACAWVVTCLMLACAALIGITIVFVAPFVFAGGLLFLRGMHDLIPLAWTDPSTPPTSPSQES